MSLLVPCADMANHSNRPNAGYRLDADAGCFRLATLQVWCQLRGVCGRGEVCRWQVPWA